MTPLQLHLSGVLEPDELRRCRADAAEYMAATSREGERTLPEGFGKTPGGKWLNCHGWSESLEGLCRQKRLWPIVLELTVRTQTDSFRTERVASKQVSIPCRTASRSSSMGPAR